MRIEIEIRPSKLSETLMDRAAPMLQAARSGESLTLVDLAEMLGPEIKFMILRSGYDIGPRDYKVHFELVSE